jgi:4-hydroxybenzoate polyprenyltransferase
VLRPTLFFPCWALFLAGVRASNRGLGLAWWKIVASMAVMGVAMGVIYLINQLRDVGTDRINQKLPYFTHEIISVRFAWWEVYILVVLSVLAAAVISWIFLAIIVIALIITGGMYNYSPFTLKDNPLGGIAASVGGGMLAFLAGAEAGGGLSWMVVLAAVPYLLAFVSNSLWTAIPDIEGDKAVGKRTFAVQFGLERTLWLGCLGVAAAVIFGFVLHDWVIGWAALLSLILFLAASFKKQISSVMLAIKGSIFILSVLLGWYFPWYLLLMATYYLLARWYHHRRFGLVYPSLMFDMEKNNAQET